MKCDHKPEIHIDPWLTAAWTLGISIFIMLVIVLARVSEIKNYSRMSFENTADIKQKFDVEGPGR